TALPTGEAAPQPRSGRRSCRPPAAGSALRLTQNPARSSPWARDCGSMTEYRRRLAITIGDPAGIGPEVVLRSLTDSNLSRADVTLVGPGHLWRTRANALGLAALLDHIHLDETEDPEPNAPLALGRTSA